MTVKNVSDLIDLSDSYFVDALYRDVLCRPPDVDGYHYYLNSVRSGARKAAIIWQVALSAEGRRSNAVLPGLQELLAAEKKERYLWRRLFGRGRRMERQLYRLENQLGRMAHGMRAVQAENSPYFSGESGADNISASSFSSSPVMSLKSGLSFPDLCLTRRAQEILGRLVF